MSTREYVLLTIIGSVISVVIFRAYLGIQIGVLLGAVYGWVIRGWMDHSTEKERSI